MNSPHKWESLPPDPAERQVLLTDLGFQVEMVARTATDSKSEDYVVLQKAAELLHWMSNQRGGE